MKTRLDDISHKDIARLMAKLLGRLSLYGMGHAASAEAISSFYGALSAVLSAGHMTISAADNKILINGAVAEENGPLFQSLSRLSLHSISLEQSATKDDVTGLLKALVSNNGQALEQTLYDLSVRNIKLNTVHYVRTGEKPHSSEEETPDPIEELGSLSLDLLIRRVVERAISKDEDRKKVFDIVMAKFSGEVAERVNEATLEIKKEKESIEREKKDAENMIASSVLGSITVDNSGNVVMLNPEGEKVMGGRLAEKAGKPVWEGVGEGKMVTILKEGGAVLANDVMVRGEDETKRLLRASNAVIRNIEGKMVGIFSVLSDITKYKELEKLKRDFVANVTHELRTPLVATRQSLSNMLTLTRGLDEDQQKMLSIALRNTERLSRLVNDILDFSKIEAGKMKLRQEIVDAGAFLKEAISTLTSLSEGKGVSLQMDTPTALPRLFIDRDRAMQVIINLLSNAVKFTDTGGSVTVTTPGVKNERGNTFLEIAISDTGRGIDRKDIDKIFDKFIQVGASDNTTIRGTGLGLAITKAIVEEHGGRVLVESEHGKGSIFTVMFPMLPEDTVYLSECVRQQTGGKK